jgi:hypothetical protein
MLSHASLGTVLPGMVSRRYGAGFTVASPPSR